jgi:hypothetical protein
VIGGVIVAKCFNVAKDLAACASRPVVKVANDNLKAMYFF